MPAPRFPLHGYGSGFSITLGGDITTTAASSLIADTIALDIILDADRTITTNTDHDLTISGIISEDASPRILNKSGGGTLALSGANSYTGKTFVNGGTLSITNRTAASGIIAVGAAGSGATVMNLGAGNNFTFTATTTSRIDVGGDAGASAGDSGEVNHSAGDITFISGGGNQLLVGFVGTGTYNLSGGSLTTTTSTSAGVTLGVRDNTTATFNLSGTGSLQMESGSFLQIGRFSSSNSGNNATTLFNQTGGVANVGILSIGGVNTATNRGKGGTHTLTVTGGTFTANTFPRLAAANDNTAIINIGGTADVTLPNFPTARGTGASATLNLDGGILRNSSASGTFIAGLTNAFIQDGGATFDTSLNSSTISQDLLEDPGSTGGGLTKQGANTLTLSGTNTYTGPTTVTTGTLVVTGSLGATAVTVNNLATLGGNGNIGGDVTIDSGATHSLAVADTPGAQVTRAITGTLSLTAGNLLELTAAATPADGEYVLATADTISGTPTTIEYNGIPGTVTVDTASNPDRLLLNVTSAGFSSWITGPFANGTVTNQGPNDDDDNDGIPNLVEYAIAGEDPTVPNPTIGTFDGETLSFTKRGDATGLTYAIEESTDLGIGDDWDEVTHNPPNNPYINNTTIISYTLTPGTPAKAFFRLQVTQP
jgi:autotransporter-associated beta strand protein